MTEEYSAGYQEGYRAGWNEAMDKKPAAWQGLTDAEILECEEIINHRWGLVAETTRNLVGFVREIEAKLKDKNNAN